MPFSSSARHSPISRWSSMTIAEITSAAVGGDRRSNVTVAGCGHGAARASSIAAVIETVATNMSRHRPGGQGSSPKRRPGRSNALARAADDGASGCRSNVELAAQTAPCVAACWRGHSPECRRRIEAPAVVAHRKIQCAPNRDELDGRLCRAGVTGDVIDRLLEYEKHFANGRRRSTANPDRSQASET